MKLSVAVACAAMCLWLGSCAKTSGDEAVADGGHSSESAGV